MTALRRCDELITEFRIRLGEPTVGTFGTVYYDGIRGNVDELRAMLNIAQKRFTFLCYSPNQSIIESTVYFEVLSGVTRYTLPETFLAPVAMFHRTRNQEYEVEKKNLFPVRARNRSEVSNWKFEFYDIRERVPLIAATGIIEADNDTEISGDDLDAVRPGDTAYNLTDGSQSTINAIFPTQNKVVVDGLTNGEANVFRRGDVYQIDMREMSRDAIDLYPRVTRDDTKRIYNGKPTNWQVQADAVVYFVFVDLSSLPSNLEDDELFVLQLLDGNDEVIAEGSRVSLDRGKNEFPIVNPIQIREGQTYSVRLQRPYKDTTIDVDSIQVDVKSDPESLDFRFAAYPKVMEKETDYSEMPEWAHEGMFAYAMDLAFKKMTRSFRSDPSLKLDVNQEKEIVKDFLYNRDERGPHQVPVAGGNRSQASPFPGNYSVATIDPWDIL